ncbi:MAG: ribonuclease HII [Methanomicrobiales archaeon]|nr:ribonuclease HII [Methanomicrobiales archaeon]
MICGVDEAGKGAVLGPLVVAAVACHDDAECRSLGARDSKDLTPLQRARLFQEITARFPCAVISYPAGEIDAFRKRMTLNDFMVLAHAEVISRLGPDLAYVDACDVDARRYGRDVSARLRSPCRIISEHHADHKYAVVGAASIVAKVTRDEAIAALASVHGEIGSGYPSDPYTVAHLESYLNAHHHPPPYARRSWATIAALQAQREQRKLGDY